jgi:hypothetical protein
MASANEFPPEKVRVIVSEVASLLKERKESISVAETVSLSLHSHFLHILQRVHTYFLQSSARMLVVVLSG